MAKLARDVMTQDPACCLPGTTLDQVAKMMVENNCGEIPIVDRSNHPIGVVTDRDIVCRVVAEGRNPTGQTADSCMTRPVVTVPTDAPLDEVIATMEDYQIRRVPVIDEGGCLCRHHRASRHCRHRTSTENRGAGVRDLTGYGQSIAQARLRTAGSGRCRGER